MEIKKAPNQLKKYVLEKTQNACHEAYFGLVTELKGSLFRHAGIKSKLFRKDKY